MICVYEFLTESSNGLRDQPWATSEQYFYYQRSASIATRLKWKLSLFCSYNFEVLKIPTWQEDIVPSVCL